jgi:maleate cis-trans isomerase
VINYDKYQQNETTNETTDQTTEKHIRRRIRRKNNIYSLEDEELLKISEDTGVSLLKVKEKHKDMVSWMEEVPSRKNGRDFNKTLRNWLRKDTKKRTVVDTSTPFIPKEAV